MTTAGKLTLGSAKRIKRLMRDFYAQASRNKRDLLPVQPALPWLGHVVAVQHDASTGSIVVAVREVLSVLPYDYDHTPGSEVFAWAGFDSLPKVGHTVKVSPMRRTIDLPFGLLAEIIISARQDTMPFPDASCVATALAPCVPQNPTATCLLQPVE